MKDYLKQLCDSNKIQLTYSDEDYIALSVGANSSGPIIRANTIFKGCPEVVAKAVIGYYTESEEENFLKVLTGYLNDNVVTVEYTIEPPDETFKNVLRHIEREELIPKAVPKKPRPRNRTTKSNGSKSSTSAPKVSEDDLSLVEMEISSIIKKNFFGDASNIKPDDGIKPSSDDVVELDIEVDDPKI